MGSKSCCGVDGSYPIVDKLMGVSWFLVEVGLDQSTFQGHGDVQEVDCPVVREEEVRERW